MSPPLTKTRISKPCQKHPELGGLRFLVNYACVQCSRDLSNARRIARRDAAGKTPRVLYTPEQAAERIRLRNLARGKIRRQDPDYNAKQVERRRLWREKNSERHLATSRAYDAKQMAENLQRRISKNLRHRLRKAMLGETKGVSAVRDLGMSIPDFRRYIESLFGIGMTWENYGNWHLDHKQPLAAFDLTDPDQARVACHYSNIQPLWALENQRKYCKAHRETFDEFHTQAKGQVIA